MKFMMKFFALLVFLASTVHAATPLFVSPTGNDANDGASLATPKLTIQAAINAVDPNGTVNIADGTYTEQLTISKNILLAGASRDTVTIVAPAVMTINFPNATASESLFAVVGVNNAASVEIQNVSVSGTITVPGGANRYFGVFVGGGASVNLHDAKVLLIREEPLSGVQRGIAIGIGRSASAEIGTGTIARVEVSGYQKGGIVVDGIGSSANISASSFTGAGPIGTTAQNGIQISRGATGSIVNNTVSLNQYSPGTTSASNIILFQPGAVTVSDNTITDGDLGIYVTENSGLVAIGSNTISTVKDGLFIDKTSNVTVGAVAFNTISSSVVSLGTAAFTGTEVDATNITVDGTAVSAMTRAQLLALEDRIGHGIDNPSLGLVRVRAANVYTTINSFSPPTTTTTSIQRAINIATAGDTVNVGAGNFNENINVNKRVTVLGNGSTGASATFIQNAGSVVTVSASGTSTNRTALQDLCIQNGTYGIFVDSTVSFIGLTNIVSTNHGQWGVYISSNAVVQDLALTNCSLIGNSPATPNTEPGGLWISGSVDTLLLDGCSLSNNGAYGFYSQSQIPVNPLTNVTIKNTQVTGNGVKGLYLEKLNNALFDTLTVSGGTVDNTFFAPPSGIDINLKYAAYTNITLRNITAINNGLNNAVRGESLGVKARNDSPSYNGTPATLTNMVIDGGTYGAPNAARPAISLGNNVADITFTNAVSIAGSPNGIGINSFITHPASATNLGNTAFDTALSVYVFNNSARPINATSANFGSTDNFAIEDKIIHGVDVGGFGLVRVVPANVYVTVNSFLAALATTTPSIQRAANVASDSDTVNIQAGDYGTQAVALATKALTLSGPNAAIDPNVGTRATEAILKGASTIALSNGTSAITIHGLRFENTTAGNGVIEATGASNNVTVARNIFFQPTPVAVYAVSTARSNWTVTQNRILSVQGTTGGTFSSNGPSGVRLYDLTNLTFSYNYIDGTPYAGILTDALTTSSIIGNRVFNTPEQGIQVAGTSANVTVSFNEVTNANLNNVVDKGGIRLYGSTFTGPVSVLNNVVTNSLNGLTIRDGSNDLAGKTITVSNNNFGSNATGVYRAAGGTGTLVAENNWFGNATGPTSAQNPGGTGNAVSTGVDFSPWLSSGVDTAPLVTTSFATLTATVGFQPTAGINATGTRLVFVTQPVGGIAGSPFSTQPILEAQDDNGVRALNVNETVLLFLSTNPSGAALTGTAMKPMVNGRVAFDGLSLDQAGAGFQFLAFAQSLPFAFSNTFTVSNPLPAITTLAPANITAGAASTVITLTGTSFVSDSTVTWNSVVRTTSFVSATELIAVIPAADLTTSGTATLTVVNPGPGGGTSNSATFTIDPKPAFNAPPEVLSAAIATPNPASVGDTVTFSINARDPEGQPLTVTWTMGDGSTQTGAQVNKNYTIPGTYQVLVSLTDGSNNIVVSGVTLQVVAGAAAAPTEPLNITKKAISAKIPTLNKDMLQLRGTLTLPDTATSVAGQAVVTVGAQTFSFNADVKGKAVTGVNKLNFKGKFKKGTLTTKVISFQIRNRGEFGSLITAGGVAIGTSGIATIPVTVVYAGKTYATSAAFAVKGTANSFKAK